MHFQGKFGNHLFQLAAVLDSSPTGPVKFCNCSSSDSTNGGRGTLYELLIPGQRWCDKFNFTHRCKSHELAAYKLSLGIGNRFRSQTQTISKARFSNFGSEILLRNDYFVCHGYFESRVPSQASIKTIDSMLVPPENSVSERRSDSLSLAIHYRRREFVGTDFGALSNDYYARALSKIFGQLNPKVQVEINVFGDSFEGLADSLPPPSRFGNMIESINFQQGSVSSDFQLMRQADLMILSNSTFAYWAALLNIRRDSNSSTVICPSPYYLSQPFDQEVPTGWEELPSTFIE